MLETLFSSKNRVALLAWLFSHDESSLSASEIVKGAGVDMANATRELKRLVASGLLIQKKVWEADISAFQRCTLLRKPQKLVRAISSGGECGYPATVSFKKYNLKTLLDTDEWLLGEDIPDIDLCFAQIWLRGFPNEFAHPAGRAYKRVLTVFRGYHLWFYYGTKDSARGRNDRRKDRKNSILC